MRIAVPIAAAAALVAVSAGPSAAALTVTAIYQARLLVKLADLRTDQIIGPAGYRAGARLVTVGALGLIKPSALLDQAEGGALNDRLTPRVFVQVEKNGAKRRTVRFGRGDPAIDPLTLMVRATLQPVALGPCLGTVTVYDGRQRYELSLTPTGTASIQPSPAFGLERATACRIGFRPLTGFGRPSKRPALLRAAPVATYAWRRGAAAWVLTDVTFPTILGDGHVALTGLSVTGARPSAAPMPAPPRRRSR